MTCRLELNFELGTRDRAVGSKCTVDLVMLSTVGVTAALLICVRGVLGSNLVLEVLLC